MNTKLTFYCTHADNYGFKKLIFETVTSDHISDIYDARNWVDEHIDQIYNKFDLYLVFDWVVINHHVTDEDVKDIKLIESVSGKLVFDDEIIKKVKKPRVKKVKEEKKEEPRKRFQSVWIDPLGKTYKIAFACHNDFASHWLKINDKELFQKSLSSTKYAYEFLQDKGWTRILGWTNPVSFVIPAKITPKIKSAIREYCLSQKIDYKEFPDILKS